ncbi:hypothetical protein F2Q70_00031864 [Brassica cretica]|uniref:Uncharacterized protein n=1 Tax=Brassica cretica TaxID=69181 RepID=A0A8S9H087_BRACR|nr:hypothetical protein F2Q70_00031864 [Brassica cretica]KAF2550264.1 hypothetical protein F2Q68_00036272 [Brassica cretica]
MNETRFGSPGLERVRRDEVGSSIVLVDSWTNETRSACQFFFSSGLGWFETGLVAFLNDHEAGLVASLNDYETRLVASLNDHETGLVASLNDYETRLVAFFSSSSCEIHSAFGCF